MKLAWLVLVPLVLTACHRNRSDSALRVVCAPGEARRAAELDPAHLLGDFDVTFVTTEGLRSGRSTAGRLALRPQQLDLVPVAQPDSSVVVVQPAVGRLALELDSIGAARMGDPLSDSATAPGVAMYVTRTTAGDVADILARVGSASTARGQMPSFDAGFFTLFVRRLGPEGIWGDWRSSPGAGAGPDSEAGGHFCALRRT